ncbi:hypothetical protein [Pseudanabaena biceps]|nr:hypothetical protein [Pseudanabaena biceps]
MLVQLKPVTFFLSFDDGDRNRFLVPKRSPFYPKVDRLQNPKP